MLKQKVRKSLMAGRFVPIVLAGAVLTMATFGYVQVQADTYDEQIQALRAQNAQTQQTVNQLAAQASSYEDAINKLGSQIGSLQEQIVANQNKQTDIQNQIVQAQADLDHQKQVLGENIKAMYLEDKISTLEILASSKNLSEYVDRQQARNAVSGKVQTAVAKIAGLKIQLKQQKDQIDGLLLDQQNQRSQLSSAQNQQSAMLSYTEGQKAAYSQQIRDTQSKITQLQQAQIAANSRLFGGGRAGGVRGGGGYPYGDAYCTRPGWADPPCGNYDWGYSNSIYDEFGYGYRNCTSWVAFKLAQAGNTGFSQLGNASDWPDNVPRSWYSIGGGAQPGDAAVRKDSGFGHVMYVERVNADGTISVSDYNRYGDGLYRSADLSGSTISQGGLYFIHFPG